MDAHRRRCTQGLLALICLRLANDGAATAPRARGGVRVDVRDHGARGDGRRDETRPLQAAIDALPSSGGTVLIPTGRYLIDPVRSLRLRSGMHLQMDAGTYLIAMPNAAARAYVLSLHGAHDVEVSGGRIVGDREHHLSERGEWGHGIMVRGSSGITLRDMHISKCWGDGISLGGISGTRPVPSRDVLISNVVCAGNRRQGLTIGRSRQVRVLRSEFLDTGGTLPGCGIDVEPDPGDLAQDIVIEACLARGNRGAGIQLYERSRQVTIRRCRILANRGDGILVRGGEGCLIEDNEINGNGLRGVAIRGSSRQVRVSANRFRGNARAARADAGRERGWMHVDVAATATAVRVDRSNRIER